MKPFGKVLIGAMLVLPAAAQAQRPSATMQTRSAELYLSRALQNSRAEEKDKLLHQALELALQGVKNDGGNSKTWFTLGEVYTEMGDAIGADSAFDKAEAMWPDYKKDTESERMRAFGLAFNAGVAAIQKNDVPTAVARLEAASAVYGGTPTAALNLGNLYAKLNQTDKAVAAYRQALTVLRGPTRQGIKPEQEKQWAQWEEAASFNLAQLLATADKNEEAAQAYQDYLKANPGNITAQSNLAVVYNRMGKKDEAQKIYQGLLSQNLSDEDFFAVGVGLFRGNQYAAAADAFRKAIAKNPANRDMYYNLSQALYSQISDLEEQRSKLKPTETKAVDAKLKPLYEELISVAQKGREFDPNNRNLLALLARGYRGMADMFTEPKVVADWKNKTLETMKQHQDMPYEVTDVTLVPSEGQAKITGNVVNAKGTAGAPVKLTISVLGKDGKELGSQDVTVTAPKMEDATPFSVTLKTAEPLGGWKYVIAK